MSSVVAEARNAASLTVLPTCALHAEGVPGVCGTPDAERKALPLVLEVLTRFPGVGARLADHHYLREAPDTSVERLRKKAIEGRGGHATPANRAGPSPIGEASSACRGPLNPEALDGEEARRVVTLASRFFTPARECRAHEHAP